MGFSLAWFGVQGIEPDDFLERADLYDTGEPDEYFEAEQAGADLPGGWYVMVTERVEIVDPAKLAEWSAGARLIVVVVDEGSMNSLAMEWADGRQVWSVFYDGSEGGDMLQVEGVLPAAFEEIREGLAAQEDGEEGGEEAGEEDGDRVFEAPLDLAERIVGFRHDTMGFDDDGPVFTALEQP